MTNLIFKRKLSRSEDNKASVITIPRSIALAWQEHNTVDLIFDGNCLVIKPTDELRLARGDQEA
jgi:virulence-associated protein VagC